MKVLVSDAGVLKSAHEIVDFNISGLHILDIPTYLNVDLPSSATEASTIALRLLKFKIQHFALPNSHYEDFLVSGSQIDIPNSSGIIMGSNKQTSILPAGVLQTTALATPFPSPTSILMNFIGFYKFTDFGPPFTIVSSPQRLLYNHNGTSIIPFNPADIEVKYSEDGGATFLPLVGSMGIDTITGVSSPPTIILKFINISSNIVYMMDWTLLYD